MKSIPSVRLPPVVNEGHEFSLGHHQAFYSHLQARSISAEKQEPQC